MSEGKDRENSYANEFVNYVHQSPSPYHCVATSKEMLKKAGYVGISEKNWADIKPNGKYYFSRNQSTLVAFAVGGKWSPGNGFTAMVAHTDSPTWKIKPTSKKEGSGYLSVGVAPYGGGLWHTWFDRDLSIAGRAVVRKGDGAFESKLVKVDRPIMSIPNLCIHLTDRSQKGFAPNKETETVPVLATAIKAELLKPTSENDKEKTEAKDNSNPEASHHHSLLMSILCNELSCQIEDICDFDLRLFDTQPPRVGGALNEFVYSARLDNQAMCFVLLNALLKSETTLTDEPTIRIVTLFDDEEIGSQTARGADSQILPNVLERLNGRATLDSALQKSVVISADMAHAVHPNYPQKHENNHKVAVHKGLVIKHNSQERYATTAVGAFLVNEVARRHSLPIQRFAVKNDSPCGSTVGPMLSSLSGIRTIDCGVPQLAMHSVREMCGTADLLSSTELLTHFFNEYSALDANLTVEVE